MSKNPLPTLDQLFTETCRLISLGGPAALPGMQFPADTLRGAVEFVVRSHSQLPDFGEVQPSWDDVSSQLAPWKEQLFEEVGGAEHLDRPGAWIFIFAAPTNHYVVIETVRQIICASVTHYLMKRIAHERPDLLDEDWYYSHSKTKPAFLAML